MTHCENEDGQEGVYYVEGVGYCTGLAWAEENARGDWAVKNPDGSMKEPVWKEWDDGDCDEGE